MSNYNLTTLWAGNNIYDYFVAVDTLTGNLISTLLLVVLFAIIYFSSGDSNFGRKITYGSFGSLAVGSLMFGIGLVSSYILVIFGIMFFASLLIEAFS